MTRAARLVDVAEADRARSVKELVLGGAYVTTDELLDILAGAPSRGSVARMRAQGSLVGVRVARRGYLHPDFQLDVSRGRVDPVIARVNKSLTPTLGHDDTIRWWLTARSGSDAVTPAVMAETGRLDELHGRVECLLSAWRDAAQAH